jgi:hypothetical protein
VRWTRWSTGLVVLIPIIPQYNLYCLRILVVLEIGCQLIWSIGFKIAPTSTGVIMDHQSPSEKAIEMSSEKCLLLKQ